MTCYTPVIQRGPQEIANCRSKRAEVATSTNQEIGHDTPGVKFKQLADVEVESMRRLEFRAIIQRFAPNFCHLQDLTAVQAIDSAIRSWDRINDFELQDLGHLEKCVKLARTWSKQDEQTKPKTGR